MLKKIQGIAWNIIELEETVSTNLYLRDRLLEEKLSEYTIVSTNFQTSGRGQKGNSWSSNRGENLLFSILIFPNMIVANEQFIISQIVALSIRNVLSRITDGVMVKWPNDIYCNEKKIAGILIENNLFGKTIESSIIGIGININQKIFTTDLINPVSLFQITGKEFNRDSILEEILSEFGMLYDELKQNKRNKIESQYFENLYRLHGYHWYKDVNGIFQAKIMNVLPSGYLVLRAIGESVDREYSFKEVQFVK